jgi:DNA invertase Pin-like site-specific DNA recombinase
MTGKPRTGNAMLVGYAAVGSAGQSLEIQLRALCDAGCAKVFSGEQSWMSSGARDPLQSAIDFVREGDTLMVAQPDCLARFSKGLHDSIARLTARGVNFRCL